MTAAPNTIDGGPTPLPTARFRRTSLALGPTLLGLTLVAWSMLLPACPAGADTAKADSLFQAGTFEAAAAAYAEVTLAEPGNGRAWYRLGMSRARLGDHRGAVEALTRSEAIGRNPVVMYNLGCSHARLGEADRAFEWLRKSLAAGYSQSAQLEADDDLASLHGDARWSALVSDFRKAGRPCATAPEWRQFDFWIGDWEVRDTAGNFQGTNSVLLLLGDCVLNENWTDGSGNSGKSYNFYNATTGKWQQTWVDDKGGVQEYSGAFVDGAMRFTRESKDAAGRPVRHRLTFFSIAPDHVRQFAERSIDEGRNWTVDYDLHYRRKAASPAR